MKEQNSSLEIIKKHIEMWEKERNHLTDLISKANTLRYELQKGKNTFKCPEGLPKEDAICPECDKCMPDLFLNEGRLGESPTLSITYPNRKPEVRLLIKGNKFGERYCKEWKKKIIPDACGCGGKHTCICGYKSTFCLSQEPEICPFCGRTCEVEYFNPMFDMNQIFSLTSKNDNGISYI